MTKKRLLQLLVLLAVNLSAQVSNQSVLTHEDYLENPFLYLSKLSNSKVPSAILIDRVQFHKYLLNVNGNDKVTTLSTSEWAEIYSDLQIASSDTNLFPSVNLLEEGMDLMYHSEKTFPIGIIDVACSKISQSALSSGQMQESADFLNTNMVTNDAFTQERIVAISCLNHNVFGDEVNFFVGDFFIFSNDPKQILESIEIDFDDGLGYRKVLKNNVVKASYDSGSGFLNIKSKLFFYNESTNSHEIRYANSSVFRTGTGLPANASKKEMERRALGVDKASYYPLPVYDEVDICKPGCTDNSCCITGTVVNLDHSIIEYNIIYSDSNTDSNKLRRPIIICDGFDPGDRRNYEINRIGLTAALSKEKDYRGLKDLFNGKPSPWYPGDKELDLISRLTKDGYDVVFVNFLNGAADIRLNAGENGLRGFLNDVINSSEYRDNKTEEITLIGPSMGGLITRHALTKMEKNNEEHFVKNWISFDAPHKGANIPLGLQYAVNFLSKIKTGGIPIFKDVKASFVKGKASLNTPAAKQMLIQHYSTNSYTGKATSMFKPIYDELNDLGYPKLSKNFGISNGGNSTLYLNPRTEILDFKMSSLTYVNATGNGNDNGQFETFSGVRVGFNNDEQKETRSQIAYGSATGGWNTALYSLNCHPENKNVKSINNTEYVKSTFITTASAFGVDVDRETVLDNHKGFTNCNDDSPGKIKTPFDEIKGMKNNEEHVRISSETADYLVDHILRDDFYSSKRPRSRANEKAAQDVKGEVAYTAIDKYVFAGDGTEFTLNKTADVLMKSGRQIVFKPGFKAKKGGILNARIEKVDYGTVFYKRAFARDVEEYTESPYTGEMFDYSSSDELKVEGDDLGVTPNPFSNSITIALGEMGRDELISVELFSSTGTKVFSEKTMNTGDFVIDSSSFKPGVYICVVKTRNEMKTKKVVKL